MLRHQRKNKQHSNNNKKQQNHKVRKLQQKRRITIKPLVNGINNIDDQSQSRHSSTTIPLTTITPNAVHKIITNPTSTSKQSYSTTTPTYRDAASSAAAIEKFRNIAQQKNLDPEKRALLHRQLLRERSNLNASVFEKDPVQGLALPNTALHASNPSPVMFNSQEQQQDEGLSELRPGETENYYFNRKTHHQSYGTNHEPQHQNKQHYYFEAITLIENHAVEEFGPNVTSQESIRNKIFPFGLSVAINKTQAHKLDEIRLSADSVYYISQLDYAVRHMLNSFSKLGTKQVKGIKVTLFGSQFDIENRPWDCYRGIITENLRLRGSTLMKIPLSLAITDIDRPITHVLTPPIKQKHKLKEIMDAADDQFQNTLNSNVNNDDDTQTSAKNTLFVDPYAIRVHDGKDTPIQPANVSKQIYPYLNIANALVNDERDLRYETTKPHQYFVKAMYRSMLSPSTVNKYSFPFCKTPYVMRNDENTNFIVSKVVKSPLVAAFCQVGDRLMDRFEDDKPDDDAPVVVLNVEDPIHREYIRWKFGEKFLEKQLLEHEANKIARNETMFNRWVPRKDKYGNPYQPRDTLEYINQRWPIEVGDVLQEQRKLPRHPDQPSFDDLRAQLEALEIEEKMLTTSTFSQQYNDPSNPHNTPSSAVVKAFGLQEKEFQQLTEEQKQQQLEKERQAEFERIREELLAPVDNIRPENPGHENEIDQRYDDLRQYFKHLPAGNVSRKRKFKILRKYRNLNVSTAPTLMDIVLGPDEPDPPTFDNRKDFYEDVENNNNNTNNVDGVYNDNHHNNPLIKPKKYITPEDPDDDMAGGSFEVGVDPLMMGMYHPQIPLHKIRNLMYKQVKRLQQPLDIASDEIYRLINKLIYINPATLDHPMVQNITKSQGIIQQSCAAVGLNAFNKTNSSFLSTHSLAMTMSHILSRTLDFPSQYAQAYYEWKVFEEYQMDSVVIIRTAADVFRHAIEKHEKDLQKAVDERQERLKKRLSEILTRKIARNDPRYGMADFDRIFDLDLSDSEFEDLNSEDFQGNDDLDDDDSDTTSEENTNNNNNDNDNQQFPLLQEKEQRIKALKKRLKRDEEDLNIVVTTPSFSRLQLPHTALTDTIDYTPEDYVQYFQDKQQEEEEKEKLKIQQLEEERRKRREQRETLLKQGLTEDEINVQLGHPNDESITRHKSGELIQHIDQHADNHNNPAEQVPLHFKKLPLTATHPLSQQKQPIGLIGQDDSNKKQPITGLQSIQTQDDLLQQLAHEQKNAAHHFSRRMLPTTMMVPYLDMLNHASNNDQHNTYVSFELTETNLVGDTGSNDLTKNLAKKKKRLAKLYQDSKLGKAEQREQRRAAIKAAKRRGELYDGDVPTSDDEEVEKKGKTANGDDDDGAEDEYQEGEDDVTSDQEDDPSKYIAEMVSNEDIDLCQRMLIAMNVEIDHLKLQAKTAYENVEVTINKTKPTISRPQHDIADQIKQLQLNIRILDKALSIINVPNKMVMANVVARRDIFPGEELMLSYHRLDDNDPNVLSVSPHLPEIERGEVRTLQQRDYLKAKQRQYEFEREAEIKAKNLEQQVDELMLKYDAQITMKHREVEELTKKLAVINSNIRSCTEVIESLDLPLREVDMEATSAKRLSLLEDAEKKGELQQILKEHGGGDGVNQTLLSDVVVYKELKPEDVWVSDETRVQDYYTKRKEMEKQRSSHYHERALLLEQADMLSEDISLLFDKVDKARKRVQIEFDMEEAKRKINNENYTWKQMTPQQLLMNYGIILPHLQQTPLQLELKDERARQKIKEEEVKIKQLKLDEEIDNLIREEQRLREEREVKSGEIDRLLKPRAGVLKSQQQQQQGQQGVEEVKKVSFEELRAKIVNQVLFEQPTKAGMNVFTDEQDDPNRPTSPLLAKIRQRQKERAILEKVQKKIVNAEIVENPVEQQQKLLASGGDGNELIIGDNNNGTILKRADDGHLSESEIAFRQLQQEAMYDPATKQQEIIKEVQQRYLEKLEGKDEKTTSKNNKNKNNNNNNIDDEYKVNYTATTNNNINHDIEHFNVVLDMNEVALRHYQRKTFITDFIPDVSPKEKLEIVYINQQLKQEETRLLEHNELMAILRRRLNKIRSQRNINENFVFGNNPLDILYETDSKKGKDNKDKYIDPIKLSEVERKLTLKKMELEQTIINTTKKIQKLQDKSGKFLECTTLIELLHGNCPNVLPPLYMSLAPVDPKNNRYGYSVCFDKNNTYDLHDPLEQEQHERYKPTILHLANTNLDRIITFILDELYDDKYKIFKKLYQQAQINKDLKKSRLVEYQQKQALRQQKIDELKAKQSAISATPQRRSRIMRPGQTSGLNDEQQYQQEIQQLLKEQEEDERMLQQLEDEETEFDSEDLMLNEDIWTEEKVSKLSKNDQNFLRRIKTSEFYSDILNITDNYNAQTTLLAPRLLYEVIATTWIEQNIIKDINKNWVENIRKENQPIFDYHLLNDIDLTVLYTATDYPQDSIEQREYEQVLARINSPEFQANEKEKIKIMKKYMLSMIPHPKQLLIKCYENIWLDNSKENMNKKYLKKKIFDNNTGMVKKVNQRGNNKNKKRKIIDIRDGSVHNDPDSEELYDSETTTDDYHNIEDENDENVEYSEDYRTTSDDEDPSNNAENINGSNKPEDKEFDANQYIKEINTLYQNQNYRVQKHITDENFKTYTHLSNAAELLGQYRKQQIDTALYVYAHYYDKLQRM